MAQEDNLRTVIFDLDGTLADTSADLIRAANDCFAAAGHARPLDPVADMGTAFHGGRAMLRLGAARLRLDWDEAAIDAAFPVFLELYERGIDRETRLYAGVREALSALAAAGVRLGVCTNKPERLAAILLDRLGIAGAFGALVGADTLPVRKPDPAPLLAAVERAGGSRERAILVGDTETDARTARAAGVRSVLVTFGPEGAAVRRFAPDATLDRFEDLPAMVEALGL
ncbi:MAG: HAD family hydrolase [Alphaproteobacteria bacterium]|nr:MAG: HAD family hydrolase [Alphaproteobacteria bacterium]